MSGKDEAVQGWSCAACTFDNTPDATKCAVCGCEAEVARQQVHKPTGHWVCAACTYSNPPSESKCTICSAPNTIASGAPILVKVDPVVEQIRVLVPQERQHIQLASRRIIAGRWEQIAVLSKTPGFAQGNWLTPLQRTLAITGVEKARRAEELLKHLVLLALKDANQLRDDHCLKCGVRGVDAVLKINSKCKPSHPFCIRCLRAYLQSRVDAKNFVFTCPEATCGAGMEESWPKELLSKKDYEAYLDATVTALINEGGGNLVRCPDPKCGAAMEVVPPTNLTPPAVITEQDEAGRPLSPEAWIHYQRCRTRCRTCQAIFCASCKQQPYHLGYTCEAFKEYSNSQHCRYCAEELTKENTEPKPPHPTLSDICRAEECVARRAWACPTRLPCGHPCLGTKDEPKHPPCLREDCPKREENVKQLGSEVNADELCNICWVESLGSAPCLQLQCGHFFHRKCAIDKIHSKWSGSRITFGFWNCALCKKEMAHPLLDADAVKQELKRLYAAIIEKNDQRLKIEGLVNDPKLTDPQSRYYRDPVAFALDSFAYYICFKCKKPYFGGRRDCEQNAAADNRPPEEFICFDCAELPNIKCQVPEHKEYHVWKCRFCCNTAVWFCFGTTHFCEPCHRDNPMEKTKRARSGFAQCKGKGICPLGVDHSPNGAETECEFSLGCGMCMDDARKKREGQGGKSIDLSKVGNGAPLVVGGAAGGAAGAAGAAGGPAKPAGGGPKKGGMLLGLLRNA